MYFADKAELKIISWKGKKYLLEITANDKENDSVEQGKKQISSQYENIQPYEMVWQTFALYYICNSTDPIPILLI